MGKPTAIEPILLRKLTAKLTKPRLELIVKALWYYSRSKDADRNEKALCLRTIDDLSLPDR